MTYLNRTSSRMIYNWDWNRIRKINHVLLWDVHFNGYPYLIPNSTYTFDKFVSISED